MAKKLLLVGAAASYRRRARASWYLSVFVAVLLLLPVFGIIVDV